MIEGEEFIYILTNRSLPGLVKIGRTDRTVAERVRELSAHTGVPTEFAIFREFRVSESAAAERAIHARLREYRLSNNREFFSLEPEVAAEVVEEIVGSGAAQVYDPEAEDELLARATQIAGQRDKVWPSLLAASLSIPHDQAERLILLLQGRGLIDQTGKPTFSSERRVQGVVDPVPSSDPATQAETPISTISGDYCFPPISLLEEADWTPEIDEDEHRRNAESLLRIFAEHDLEVSLGEIHVGPVFTRHEFAPGRGFRLERLPAVETAILAQPNAKGARVLPSIRGKQGLGVELPNRTPQPVPIRAILETEDWCVFKGALPIALGRDVGGRPVIYDLAQAPHVLIAGSRGAGRSTAIHAILASILYSKSPATVRLLMIDPTARELVRFNMLPHMLIPVVVDPDKVPAAMRWLLAEMEARFQILAGMRFSGLVEFNNRERYSKPDREALNLGMEIPDVLPHIVVIVNELADSMLAGRGEVERLIAHLTQHGAAAGIHLIAATQRPTTDVLTETIREALPLRLAFRLGSQLDSRTVVGGKGAETLLGRGDMLFGSTGSNGLIRVQGASVSAEEMIGVCAFLQRNGPPQWASSIQQYIDSLAGRVNGEESLEESPTDGLNQDEELFYQALEVLKNTRRATATMLQRRLRIGYNRASRILDVMWQKGIVGPDNGDRPRDILVDLDTY